MSTTPFTDRRRLFDQLADPRTVSRFFDQVADDVTWTVMGTHPLAGTYRSKQEFLEATFQRLNRIMRDGTRLEVRHLHVAGDIVIAELAATSTTLDMRPFDNTYCWVCRFEEDTIVEVRAYLDSALVAEALANNEPRSAS
jgi:ketosteroid isomerase-like protein